MVLGGNDISTTVRPKKIGWHLVNLCRTIRDRGVPKVVVAGICSRWRFREAALDAGQFSNMAASIDNYVGKKFLVAHMFHVKKEGHWHWDGVHLSKEGKRVFLACLKRKFGTIFD